MKRGRPPVSSKEGLNRGMGRGGEQYPGPACEREEQGQEFATEKMGKRWRAATRSTSYTSPGKEVLLLHKEGEEPHPYPAPHG